MSQLIYLMLALLAFGSNLGLAQEPIVISSGSTFEKFPTLPHLLYVRDLEGTVTAESFPSSDLRSKMKTPEGHGVFLDSKGIFWSTFAIHNQTAASVPLSMVASTADVDSIELFEVREGVLISLGMRGDRIDAPTGNYRYPAFALQITPGVHTYVMRMKSDSIITLCYYLWNPEIFNEDIRIPEYLVLGLLFGFIVVMIGYNAFLAIRLKNSTYLLYVGYITCFGIVQFIFTGIGRHLLPSGPFKDFLLNQGLLISAELTGTFAAIFATRFLNIPQKLPGLHKALRIYYPLSFANITLSFFSYITAVPLLFITNTYISILLLTAGILGSMRRYRPAYFYMAAWSFIIIGSMITMTRISGLAGDSLFTSWSQFVGGAIEVVLLSLALGDKISLEQEKSHRQITRLNQDLNTANAALKEHIENVESMVEEKTRDIRSIMTHIPLGIFMIQKNQRIHKDHSRYLYDILGSTDLESREASDIIFAGSDLNSDGQSQVASCLSASLGEERLNFELNMHSLPLEMHRTGLDGRMKIFDLTWNTIESDTQQVEKILVTMRDVTDMRTLQEKSRDQQEELEFIGEILNIPAPRFLRFLQSCCELIQQNLKLIHSQGIEKKNFEVLKILFINMHTVKGSARSLYLKRMTRILHDAEQYYAHLQKNASVPWDVHRMKRDLDEAQAMVNVYEKVAKEKLGRRLDHAHIVEFQVEQIEPLYRQLRDSVRGHRLPEAVKESLELVQSLLLSKIFNDAHEVFQDIFGCLPVLAKDLGKELPDVRLDTHGHLLTEQAEELFRNMFVHILRNSMDHGIEPTAERQLKGKQAQGRLTISMERREEYMVLTYQDDGRGLPIHKIREIGLSRGLISETEAQDAQAVAELIFDSGLSTANRLTEISGRGVGMEAVKSFVDQWEGRISIRLSPPAQHDAGFQPFALIMELPFSNLFEESHWSETTTAA